MSRIPEKCDVVIIGGGPAGVLAAGTLAKKGYDVVLLEKQRFPRNAVGESLIPLFWKFTDLIDASQAIEEEGFLIKAGGLVQWEGIKTKLSFKSFGFERPGLHVERDVFDQILINKVKELGVSVFEEINVVKVQTTDSSNGVVHYKDLLNNEEGSITSLFTVDASGQNALVAKQEKIRDFDSKFGFQAVWGYFDQSCYYDQSTNVSGFEDRKFKLPLTTVSEIGNWGWSWHIVLRNSVSVGIIIPKENMADFKKGGTNLEDRFTACARKVPLIGDLLKDSVVINNSVSSIRDYAYKSQKLVFGNCYLSGDSAAFVDPLSSEGVPLSMYGGYLAAWSIDNSLKNRSRTSFYQQLYVNEYGNRLQFFKILAYPGKSLPLGLLKAGKKIIRGFSEREILLILAQSRMTGRYDHINNILGNFEVSRATREVEYISDQIRLETN